MADSTSEDESAKQRILQHMNAHHHQSIRRYIEAYSSISMLQSHHARMVDVHLKATTISHKGRKMVIPFDPPLTSFRETRERFVEMDKKALQLLGRSDVPITGYVPPYAQFGHLCNFTLCSLTLILLSRPANAQPGSLIYDHLLFLAPGYARFVSAVRFYVFIAMILIHVFESCLMARKLKRHGLTPLDLIWWKWIGSTFIEGVTSFWRLDALLHKNRQRMEAKKH